MAQFGDERSYDQFFGFKESPFGLTPDTHFFHGSETHLRVLNDLQDAIQERQGFIVLTGPEGTGKTTICHQLMENMITTTSAALILEPALPPDQLLLKLGDKLGIPLNKNLSRQEIEHRINNFLRKQNRRDRNVCVIVDDAQDMTEESLQALRLLSDFDGAEQFVQIVLVGSQELNDLLQHTQLRPVQSRVNVRTELGNLSHEELTAYVQHRLETAGPEEPIDVDETVYDRLYDITDGNPLRTNILFDRVLLSAADDGSRVITEEYLDRTLEEFEEDGYELEAETTADSQKSSEQFSTMSVLLLTVTITLSIIIGSGGTFITVLIARSGDPQFLKEPVTNLQTVWSDVSIKRSLTYGFGLGTKTPSETEQSPSRIKRNTPDSRSQPRITGTIADRTLPHDETVKIDLGEFERGKSQATEWKIRDDDRVQATIKNGTLKLSPEQNTGGEETVVLVLTNGRNVDTEPFNVTLEQDPEPEQQQPPERSYVLKSSSLFELGERSLISSAKTTLEDLATKLDNPTGKFVVVSGHTDDVPITSGRYSSNWELSALRAASVASFLGRSTGVERDRLVFVGRSNQAPIVPNTNPSNRRENRRVNVSLVGESCFYRTIASLDLFDDGTSTLTSEDRNRLEQVAQNISKETENKVVVASSSGAETSNQSDLDRLAKQSARVVEVLTDDYDLDESKFIVAGSVSPSFKTDQIQLISSPPSCWTTPES